MRQRFRLLNPRSVYLFAVTWSFILLAPYVPGLPRPGTSGLFWRQEFLLALLLCVVFLFLAKKTWSQKTSLPLLTYSSAELITVFSATLFVLWSAASSFWSLNPDAAFTHTLQWSAYLIFCPLVCYALAKPRARAATFYALGALVWLLAVPCTLEWALTTQVDHKLHHRLGTVFRGFNGFCEVMCVIAPLYAAVALYVRRRRHALLSGATALIAWLTTIQTMQRAPLIGAAAGLLIVCVGALLLRSCRPRCMARVPLLVLALAAATFAQGFVGEALTTNETSAISRLQNTEASEVNSRLRLLFWGVAIEMLRARPLTGVGGNNYEVAYPEARAAFSATRLDDPLVELEDDALIRYAHNEYLQILAELGATGFALFALFMVSLFWCFCRAMKSSRAALPALGAGGGMLAFLISNGASGYGFRWMGGSLLFFFAAALVVSTARRQTSAASSQLSLTPSVMRSASICAFALACLLLYHAGGRGMNVMTLGTAETTPDARRAEQLYRQAIWWNPLDAPTRFSYGMWLYGQGRAAEATPHLRYAVANGMNAATCYTYLAIAETESGRLDLAEQTLRIASEVYPRTIFFRVRHAQILAALGRTASADEQIRFASALDARAARGWWHLLHHGDKETTRLAQTDKSLPLPGELAPERCVRAVIAEARRQARATSSSE